jgi:3-hydroxybutyryl-CoA dehydratase
MTKNSNSSFTISSLSLGQVADFCVDIEEADISRFAELSGDFSSIHMDAGKAREAGFRGRVVHGSLISSYFSAMVGVYLPGDTALLMQCENKFHRPAYPNTTLLIEGKVSAIHSELECVEIAMKASDEEGKRIASGKWLIKVRKL